MLAALVLARLAPGKFGINVDEPAFCDVEHALLTLRFFVGDSLMVEFVNPGTVE